MLKRHDGRTTTHRVRVAMERIKRHENWARAYPPSEATRLPATQHAARAKVCCRRVTFAGMEWNVKGLASFLDTSANNLYTWALRGHHGIGLPEGALR